MADEKELLARFLNEISQNDTHFDNCSEKVKQAYRAKAKDILVFIACVRGDAIAKED